MSVSPSIVMNARGALDTSPPASTTSSYAAAESGVPLPGVLERGDLRGGAGAVLLEEDVVVDVRLERTRSLATLASIDTIAASSCLAKPRITPENAAPHRSPS